MDTHYQFSIRTLLSNWPWKQKSHCGGSESQTCRLSWVSWGMWSGWLGFVLCEQNVFCGRGMCQCACGVGTRKGWCERCANWYFGCQSGAIFTDFAVARYFPLNHLFTSFPSLVMFNHCFGQCIHKYQRRRTTRTQQSYFCHWRFSASWAGET